MRNNCNESTDWQITLVMMEVVQVSIMMTDIEVVHMRLICNELNNIHY